MLHTVDSYHGICGLVVEQKSLYRDRGIIYVGLACRAELVALLTAISVDAVADTVEEAVGLSVDLADRQIAKLLGDAYDLTVRRAKIA